MQDTYVFSTTNVSPYNDVRIDLSNRLIRIINKITDLRSEERIEQQTERWSGERERFEDVE